MMRGLFGWHGGTINRNGRVEVPAIMEFGALCV